jgi:hypothetical protein
MQRKHFAWHTNNIKKYVQEQSSDYVFNLDEIDSSYSESLKLEQVVVPVSVTEEDMYHSISSRFEHLILLACVTVTEDSMKPMIISIYPI